MGRNLLYVAIAATLCFGAGMFVNGLLFAQDQQAASEWCYKAVDLKVELFMEDGKPLDPLAVVLDAAATQKRLETLLGQHSSGGWELVSYSGGTAVYKQKVRPLPAAR
jgi:hypothetical protein